VKLLRQFALVVFISIAAVAQTNSTSQLLRPKLLDLNTDDESSGPTNIVALRKQAVARYEAHDFEAAVKLFAQLLKQATNDSASAWRAGCCYYYTGDIKAAAGAYAQYVRLRPQIPDGHEWLGTCLSRLDKFSEAERELSTAIRLKPDKADVHDELGYVYERWGKYAQAAQQLDEAIRLGGETPYRCRHGGKAYAHVKDYSRAEMLFKKAIKYEPTNVYSFQWLGYSQYHLGRYGEAIGTVTSGLKIDPTNAYLENYLGHSYLGLKKYDLAADAFAKAAVLNPEDTSAKQSQAYALIQSHRVSEAIKVLEPCLTKDSKNKTVRLSLLAAYLLNHNYRKANGLYPVIFTAAAILLGIVYLVGSALLLYFSFRASSAEHPHLGFAIAWLLLYFESQVALMFFAGLFTSANLISGLMLAPVPLLLAAFIAFPKHAWGYPFKPAPIAWKQIGAAIGAWFAIGLVAGAYSAVVTSFTHSKPEPRNIRLVLDLVREHRALAAIAVAVLAPFTEETLFRGLLYGALSKWLKPLPTILVTSVVFGAVHMDLVYFFPLFLIGVLLGWARYASKSIWFPIGIHMVQNSIAFAIITAG
jgi:membrane protease YdiL (CAAX protease family)/Flp pilus assembly protein TadD